MKNFIIKLVNDFNEFARLVALNRVHIEEGTCDDSTLQWNRGSLNRIEEYLKELAGTVPGAKLEWGFGEHTFGYGEQERQLEYKTVHVDFDN